PRHGRGADAGQEALLLLVAAEGVDDWPDHLGAERDDPRRALFRQHILEQEATGDVPARTAVLLGPSIGEPALAAERLLPRHVIVAVVMLAGEGLGPGRRREVLAREGTDLVGEGLVLGFQSEVHASFLSVVPTGARSAQWRDLVLS